MKIFDDLTDENIEWFAFYNYRNPSCVDMDEFKEDLSRFKYLKKLINRYLESNDFQPRLIVNHLIVIFNVFETRAAFRLLKYKMDDLQLSVIKPFIKFLGYLGPNDLLNIISNSDAIEATNEL